MADVVLLLDGSLDILLVLVNPFAAGGGSLAGTDGLATAALVVTADSFERLFIRSRDGGFGVSVLRPGVDLAVRASPDTEMVLFDVLGIGVSMWASVFLFGTGVRWLTNEVRLFSIADVMTGRRSDPTRVSGVTVDPADRREIEGTFETLCRLAGSIGTGGLRSGVAIGREVTMDESVMSRVELKSNFESVESMLFRIWRRF